MGYDRIAGLALILSALMGLPTAAVAAAPTVRIDTGALQGVETSDGVVSFKGVPFAKPPVGQLRWRPPMRPEPWSGVRDAGAYGAPCMQKLIPDNGVGQGPASEDCLTLNVFTAEKDLRRGVGLPVMVWIHGGGFVNGSGTAGLYDGAPLARQGVVVVTLNYRLGRFGFFAHPALTAENPKGPLANYGLMDQIAALQWVQRNIAEFGGDPSAVTLFGESAGGMSVNRLMTIAVARGLFKRAIVESGVGREVGRTLPEAEMEGRAFAGGLKAGDTAAQLRSISAAAIVAAQNQGLPKGEGVIVDGRMVMADPMAIFAEKAENRVDYLIGSNSFEWPRGIFPPLRPPPFTPAQVAALEAAYGSTAVYADRITSDAVFTEPARSLAREHAATGSRTYLYRFSVLSAGAPKALKGAIHASDRQYVFKTLAASPWPTDARDAALAETISAYWVSFAKTGDPNGGGRPRWPRYGPSDELLDFTNEGPIAKATPDPALLDLIARSYGADAAAR